MDMIEQMMKDMKEAKEWKKKKWETKDEDHDRY